MEVRALSKNVLPASVALLSLASFYFAPNMGRSGLYMPANSLVWVVAAVVVLMGLSRLRQRPLQYPRYSVGLVLLPVLILCSGFLAGVVDPVDWLLRVLALLLSVGFLFALFQLVSHRRALDNALLLLLAGLGGHVLVGLAQLLPSNPLPGLIPYYAAHTAVGIFQQPNVQASAMALALVLSLYCLTLPGFRKRHWLVRVLPFAVLLGAAVVLFSLGSRIGFLGAASGFIVMVLARYACLWRRKIFLLLAMICVLAGAVLGSFLGDGFLRAYSKFERLAEHGADARVHVYHVGLELIAQSPVSGHGIGSFTRVFHDQAAEYMARLDPAPIIGNQPYGHPHNELLYWGVEGGVLALLGIVCAVLAVVLQLVRLGWQRGLAMLALLLPIALHAMVELPFYHSAYHWFVLLFLVFVTFVQRPSRMRPLNLSLSARYAMMATSVVMLVGTAWFGLTAVKASADFTRIYTAQTLPADEITFVHRHPYFADLSGVYINLKRLQQDMAYEDFAGVQRFIDWAELYLKKDVDVSVYTALAGAYRYLGKFEQADAIDGRLRALFPYRETE